MGRPTYAQIVCWAIRELGGTAKTTEIIAKIGPKEGSGPSLSPRTPYLNLLLSRQNGKLWDRIAPGTYRLTEAGKREADAVNS